MANHIPCIYKHTYASIQLYYFCDYHKLVSSFFLYFSVNVQCILGSLHVSVPPQLSKQLMVCQTKWPAVCPCTACVEPYHNVLGFTHTCSLILSWKQQSQSPTIRRPRVPQLETLSLARSDKKRLDFCILPRALQPDANPIEKTLKKTVGTWEMYSENMNTDRRIP